jgi:hypothetical protein
MLLNLVHVLDLSYEIKSITKIARITVLVKGMHLSINLSTFLLYFYTGYIQYSSYIICYSLITTGQLSSYLILSEHWHFTVFIAKVCLAGGVNQTRFCTSVTCYGTSLLSSCYGSSILLRILWLRDASLNTLAILLKSCISQCIRDWYIIISTPDCSETCQAFHLELFSFW